MELSVVIVSYNARDDLERCLWSLFASETSFSFEVLVADNASTDGSVDMVRQKFPRVELVLLGDNVGFARASNRCWRLATSPLVLFLNSDTSVAPNALGRLVAIMNQRPHAAILGPLLRNEDGSLQISFGRMLSLSAELRQKILDACYRNGRGPLRRYVERLHAKERSVDWVSGACLLARRDALEQVGGFDEAFFLYSEDVDLCARARATGAEVVFTPEVEVVHYRGRSADADPERAFVESQRSRLHFYKKHYGGPRLSLLKLYMTTKLGLAYLFRPSGRSAYRSVLKRVFHGDGA